MLRKGLILERMNGDPALQGAGAAFSLVLLLAIAMGGARAVSGIPALMNALIPPGLIAAEARSAALPDTVVLTLDERFPASPYASQVLTPVSSHGYPKWLAAQVEYARARATH
jgi:hypothetical protein